MLNQRANQLAHHQRRGGVSPRGRRGVCACFEPEVRESPRSVFREEDPPRNMLYADGSSIEGAVRESISELYEVA